MLVTRMAVLSMRWLMIMTHSLRGFISNTSWNQHFQLSLNFLSSMKLNVLLLLTELCILFSFTANHAYWWKLSRHTIFYSFSLVMYYRTINYAWAISHVYFQLYVGVMIICNTVPDLVVSLVQGYLCATRLVGFVNM